MEWYKGDPGFDRFRQVYDEAVSRGDAWVFSPSDVAYVFVSESIPLTLEDPPSCSIVRTELLHSDTKTAAFIFIVGNCRDDSVWGFRIRVDLGKEGKIWAVAWAGRQFKCQRGDERQRNTWHVDLCP
jgi:hypothetical protein